MRVRFITGVSEADIEVKCNEALVEIEANAEVLQDVKQSVVLKDGEPFFTVCLVYCTAGDLGCDDEDDACMDSGIRAIPLKAGKA